MRNPALSDIAKLVSHIRRGGGFAFRRVHCQPRGGGGGGGATGVCACLAVVGMFTIGPSVCAMCFRGRCPGSIYLGSLATHPPLVVLCPPSTPARQYTGREPQAGSGDNPYGNLTDPRTHPALQRYLLEEPGTCYSLQRYILAPPLPAVPQAPAPR